MCECCVPFGHIDCSVLASFWSQAHAHECVVHLGVQGLIRVDGQKVAPVDTQQMGDSVDAQQLALGMDRKQVAPVDAQQLGILEVRK